MGDPDFITAAAGETGELEGIFRGLFNLVKDGVMLTDTNGAVLDCNRACLDMLLCTKEEIRGVNFTRIVPTLSRTRICEIGRQVQVNGYADEFEGEALRTDLTAFPVNVKCCLAVNGSGTACGTWVMFRDITEHNAACMANRKQKEEMQRLVDVAAYELRQLATIFKGYSYLLMESGAEIDAESLGEAISSINEAAGDVTHIVNALDDAARIERGQFGSTNRETYPHKLILRAVQEMRAKGCDRDFVLSTYRDEPAIEADPEAIKQVLAILLENADKYSPERTSVSIWHERSGAQTIFHVADRGPGISEDDSELIFERFYQGKEAMRRHNGGIGLGLYIATKLVEANRGWIKVESRENGGCDFQFGIPGPECGSIPVGKEGSIQGKYIEADVSA